MEMKPWFRLPPIWNTQVPSRLGLPNWTSFFFGWAVKKDGVAKSDSKTSIIGGIRSHYHLQKKTDLAGGFWNYIIILSNIYIMFYLSKYYSIFIYFPSSVSNKCDDHDDLHWLSHTLWWTNIAMENGHRNSGFSHEKWWFSIAMLVHQRVTQKKTWDGAKPHKSRFGSLMGHESLEVRLPSLNPTRGWHLMGDGAHQHVGSMNPGFCWTLVYDMIQILDDLESAFPRCGLGCSFLTWSSFNICLTRCQWPNSKAGL